VGRVISGIHAAAKLRQDIKSMIDVKNPPHLGVILYSDDHASKLYIKKKQEACAEVGIKSTLIRPRTKAQLFKTIHRLNDDKEYHGIIVQLPLPKQINVHTVFDNINPLKDVDAFHPSNIGLLLQGRPRFIPCTPHGIQYLLSYHNIGTVGKKIVIINRSDIVGKPLAALLMQDQLNANGTVVVCHDKTPRPILYELCLSADIIITAVGRPNFLTPNMVTSESVVVDVAINRVDGKIVGDAHKNVCQKVQAITPVPGGVGPMTVAMLLYNTAMACRAIA